MPMPPDDAYAREPGRSLDDPNEIFDLVDLDDQVIGRVLRGEAHRNPALIHRSVQVLVFTHDGRLLLQRRSASKDLFPGYYCASASGHVASGEDYATTAERELAEELGISAPLTYISKALVQSEPETELTALFATVSDGPYRFHPTETEGGKLFAVDDVWGGVVRGDLLVTPALRVAMEELRTHTHRNGGGLAAFLARVG
ncbi:MAG TPA: NUDIX domain-containing protein [Ktedonobacterales bacterium]|jgi:isopentenyldiphosphate isomerase